MSFDSDFDEIFEDFDLFNSKFMRRFQNELNEILEDIKSGKIKGTWKIKQITEPEADGYVIRGHFGSEGSIDPLEPLKPLKRRPMPEKPFEVPKTALKENSEPLVDVFEEENVIKVYIEIPGEKKENIKLDLKPGKVEIIAKGFHKIIDLPTKNATTDIVSSEYKNGVLEITIQKKESGNGCLGKEMMV